MQGFRARSQLLVERLDDEDEVLHQPFPQSDDMDLELAGGDNLKSFRYYFIFKVTYERL